MTPGSWPEQLEEWGCHELRLGRNNLGRKSKCTNGWKMPMMAQHRCWVGKSISEILQTVGLTEIPKRMSKAEIYSKIREMKRKQPRA